MLAVISSSCSPFKSLWLLLKSRYNISQLNCAQHINMYNYIHIHIHPHPSQIFINLLFLVLAQPQNIATARPPPGPSAWLCWFFFAASCAPAAAICAADCGERPSALAARPMARAACFTWRYQEEPKWGGLNSPKMGYNIVRNII